MSNENMQEVNVSDMDLNAILSDIIKDYTERSKTITNKTKITPQEIIDRFGKDGVARLTLKEMTKIKSTDGKELIAISFKEIPENILFGGAAYQRVYKSFISVLKSEQGISDYLNAIDVFAYMQWIKGYRGANQFAVEIKGA